MLTVRLLIYLIMSLAFMFSSLISEDIFVNEKDSIKDLEAQARNTKHLMDKLNRAAYGMTFDEAIRLGKENPPPCSQHDEGKG